MVAGPSSFAGVASAAYWSSTTYQAGFVGPTAAVAASVTGFDGGFVGGFAKTYVNAAWPVRGGSR